MRKTYLSLLLLLSLLLALTACAAPQDTLPPQEENQTANTPAPEHEASVKEGGSEEISSMTVTSTTPSPEPTPAPTDTPEPDPTPYTMVWMSDTQAMSISHPEVLVKMQEYILSQKEEKNIVAILHSGDVVDNCGAKGQWKNATTGLMPLVEELPTFMAAGNHDQSTNGENRFDVFARQELTQKAWEGVETYRLGEAGYRILDLGGEQILVAVLGHVSSLPARKWLVAEINAHPDAPAILVTHSFLYGDGRTTTDGERLIETVVSQCPSMRLVVCGHFREVYCRTDGYDDDGDGVEERTVTALMYNFQDDMKEGLGYLRLLTFDPVSRNISVVTYSPWYDLYTYKDTPEESMTFILENAF